VNNLLKEESQSKYKDYNLTFVKEWVNKDRNEIYLIAELDGGINLHEFLKSKDPIYKKVSFK